MDITVKGNEMYIDNKSNSISLTTKNGVVVEQTNEDMEISTTPQTIGVELPKEIPTEGGKVQDVYVNGESVLDKNGIAQINNVVQDENYVHTDNNFTNVEKQKLAELENYDDTEIKKELENKANKTDIPDTSEFIKNTDLADTVYSKKEVDTKLENLPTGTELVAGDNTVIEDSHINVYTNTGYIISDADVKAQAISDSGTTGINEIVYDNETEIIIIYDKTAKIRRSENGIDFKLITLPFTCRSMFINPNNRRIFGLCTGYFIYSDDDGLTWNSSQNTYASSLDYIARAQGHVTGFAGVNKSIKRIYTFDANFKQTGYITSVIVPEFMTQFADHQFIWCNSAGTFKYGAGSNEGDFASLTGVTVNVLRNINGYPVVGLKNNNKIYVLKNYSGVTGNEWVEYTLPEICTVNDIVLNPNNQMYYIFTDINTYYKTKDFIEYENLEVDGLRGIQGSFTLAGIQMTTDDHNTLLLCPARTKQENKNQEVKRNQDKTKMVGKGLELDETGRFNVKSATDKIGVNANGLFLALIDKDGLTEDVLEALYTALATSKTIDPYEIENWYFGEGYPENDLYASQKFVFTQDGSFLDMATWETEITVEKNEMGYIWYDQNMSIFKYVKLGNLVELLGGVLSE